LRRELVTRLQQDNSFVQSHGHKETETKRRV
jgi:hypothetical protein